ncbi:hypothetical protein C5D04_13780 [Rathayibacter sp. AY1D2]|nr:hypothetical protein C5D04_13780 [Rathayibacter sp. AY1D2]
MTVAPMQDHQAGFLAHSDGLVARDASGPPDPVDGEVVLSQADTAENNPPRSERYDDREDDDEDQLLVQREAGLPYCRCRHADQSCGQEYAETELDIRAKPHER